MQKTVWALLALCGGAFLSVSLADAQVLTATAIYDRGIVIIRGHTFKPGQFVSVGRSLVQRSNRQRQLVFHLKQLPRQCEVGIRSGGRVQVIPIRNCPNGNRASL